MMMILFFFHLGGSELLMAHGLPIADWAAKAMGTDRWKGTGISNRGLSILAGNSMHSASVPCHASRNHLQTWNMLLY